MKRLALFLGAIPALLGAVELPLQQTPTGPYEVCISAETPTEKDAGYSIVFRERATQKLLGKGETGGGYTTPEIAARTAKVLWHASGQFVAFNDRTTKHTSELQIYSLLESQPVKLEYSDYIQNALGRVDAVQTGLHCISTPVEWIDDNLTVKLYFSVDQKETGRSFYETIVTFCIDHGPNEAPRLRFVSIQTPRNLNE
jgi:hypothetical protein